ncbi:hypothetical protein HK405_006535, partial [Cladochytrium tenue]
VPRPEKLRHLSDMTYDSVLKYSEESIRQAKELASFLKRRHAIELEYARSLS